MSQRKADGSGWNLNERENEEVRSAYSSASDKTRDAYARILWVEVRM